MTTTPSRFMERPHTKLGWWSFGLMIAFVVLNIVDTAVIALRLSLPPLFAILFLACGLGSGITSLIAIIRQHERSWIVWLPLLPGLFVLFLLIGEFLFPH